MIFSTHHENLLQALNLFERSHAILITGSPGHGTGLFGRALAKAKLCENRTQVAACDQCQSCHWFDLGHHPDFRALTLDSPEPGEEGEDPESNAETDTKSAKKVKAKTQVGIDEIRGLASFASVSGHRGGFRVVMIDPIEAVNVLASNSLLKTLEEPTANLLFILVTRSSRQVLATIRSRCQQLALPPVPGIIALAWLKQVFSIDDAQAKTLLDLASGAPEHAAALVDPELTTAYRLLVEVLARLPDTSAVDSATALQATDPSTLSSTVQRWLEDLGRVSVGSEPRFFMERGERLKSLSKRTDLARICRVAQRIDQQRSLSSHPLNPRLFCEQTLAWYCEAFSS
jgi:DNA polymerase III subunit delta'